MPGCRAEEDNRRDAVDTDLAERYVVRQTQGCGTAEQAVRQNRRACAGSLCCPCERAYPWAARAGFEECPVSTP